MLTAMTGNRAAGILAWKDAWHPNRRFPQEGETMSITPQKPERVGQGRRV
jgi:hypothetical protein